MDVDTLPREAKRKRTQIDDILAPNPAGTGAISRINSQPKPDNDGAVKLKTTRPDLRARQEQRKVRRQREADAHYGRGKKINTKDIKDKKLRRNLRRLEGKYQDAALKAKDAEILLEHTAGFLEPENEVERTHEVRQEDILDSVAVETAQKRFDLKLDTLGPYMCEYSRNGRELLLAGKKGHIATMDWRDGKLGCEIQLGEAIRDIKWLHNNQFFAVAQKKHVYIYDRQGVEIHNLRKHRDVTHMEFLPYHFLLSTIVSLDSWDLRTKFTLTNTNHRAQPASSNTKTSQPVSSSPKSQPISANPSLSPKIPITLSSTPATRTAPSLSGLPTRASRW